MVTLLLFHRLDSLCRGQEFFFFFYRRRFEPCFVICKHSHNVLEILRHFVEVGLALRVGEAAPLLKCFHEQTHFPQDLNQLTENIRTDVDITLYACIYMFVCP